MHLEIFESRILLDGTLSNESTDSVIEESKLYFHHHTETNVTGIPATVSINEEASLKIGFPLIIACCLPVGSIASFVVIIKLLQACECRPPAVVLETLGATLILVSSPLSLLGLWVDLECDKPGLAAWIISGSALILSTGVGAYGVAKLLRSPDYNL